MPNLSGHEQPSIKATVCSSLRSFLGWKLNFSVVSLRKCAITSQFTVLPLKSYEIQSGLHLEYGKIFHEIFIEWHWEKITWQKILRSLFCLSASIRDNCPKWRSFKAKEQNHLSSKPLSSYLGRSPRDKFPWFYPLYFVDDVDRPLIGRKITKHWHASLALVIVIFLTFERKK